MAGPNEPRGGLAGWSAAAPGGAMSPAARIAHWLPIALNHHAGGRLAEAEHIYRQLLALDPEQPDALHWLGVIAQQFGHSDSSVELIGKAIAITGGGGETYTNLAIALRALGRFQEAEDACRRAIEHRPAHAPSHKNLGILLQEIGRPDEAIPCYRRAIELQPGFAEAYNDLGNAFQSLGRLDEAADAYLEAVKFDPALAFADSNRLLCLTYSSALSAADLLAAHRDWDRRHAPAQAPARDHANDRDPDRRLRVGLVSANFEIHPVGFFLTNVLAARDRSAIEVVCYHCGKGRDFVTDTLRALADQWRDVAERSDDDVEAMIRSDRIDILVDLSGHTGDNRLPVFTRRPAPVQVSWLGYPGTTGLSSIDYLVMDAAAVPPGAERWCSEHVVRLPHGRFCYAPPDYAPEVVQPPPRPVTFGSFNNLTKVGPEVVRLWARVLDAAPGSRLLLKSYALAEPATRERFTRAFAEAGLDPARLELRGKSPHPEMFAEYGDVDIALDPFPFCGGLTSCEALWMGVPVVTLPGERPSSRQTLGFLEALDLGELVARDEADYVRIAAQLAADPKRRAALRLELRPRMAASPLCDGARFTRSLETALRQMWRRWCAGEPAAPFDVSTGARESP